MSGLAPATVYAFRVYATSAAGGTSAVSNVAATTTPVLPPTDLRATAVSGTRVDLAWVDNSGNEGSYELERSEDGGAWRHVTSPSANQTTYADTGVAPGRTYEYRIRAYASSGVYSEYAAAAAPAATPALAAPDGLVVTPVSPTRVELAWEDTSTEETYVIVERSDDGGANWSNPAWLEANVTRYADTDVAPGRTYLYRLGTYASPGSTYSAYTPAAEATTPTLAAPATLSAAPVSAFRIDVTWPDAGGSEQDYELERSENGGTNWSHVATPEAEQTACSDANLVPGRTYQYRLRARVYAYPSSAYSPYTAVASAATLPLAAPSNLSAAAVSGTRVDLAWTDNSDGESYFQVERSENAGVSWTQVDRYVSANVTRYADTGASPGKTYQYRVRAYANNGGAVSAFGAEATAVTAAFSAPADLVATPSSGRVELRWTDTTDSEDLFRVERSENGGTSWQEITSTGSNVRSYVDAGVLPGRTYQYRVSAYRYSGSIRSPYGNVASAAVPALAAPSGLSAVARDGWIDLAWADNSDGEDWFRLERSADGGTTWTHQASPSRNVTRYADADVTPGQAYQYRVSAYHSGANSYTPATPAAAVVAQPLAAPTDPSGVATSAYSVSISWADNSSNESNFYVEMLDPTDNSWNYVGSVGENVTSYEATGLRPDTDHQFRVRAYHNRGAYSDYTQPITLTTESDAPTDLAGKVMSPTRINLRWVDRSDEHYFEIESSTDGVTFTTLESYGPSDQPTYAATGLTPATTYHFRVRGNRDYYGDYTNYSDVVTATTAATNAPSGLVARAASGERIDLTWKDNSLDETGFRIERSTDAGATWSSAGQAPAGATRFTDTGLSPLTTYHYRVRSFNTLGESVPSARASATTLAPAPAAPADLAAAATSTTEVALTWSDRSGDEQGFRLERTSDGGGRWVAVATLAPGTAAYTDRNLSPNTAYAYRIRAFNVGGDSANSNTATVSTLRPLPAAPSALTATATSSTTRIDLAWTDHAHNELGYRVEARAPGGLFTQIATPAADATSFSATGLRPGTAYTFRVRAFSASGNSPYSNTAAAETPAMAAPRAPTDVTAAVAATGVTVSWADSSVDEEGFDVERSEDGGTTFAPLGEAGAGATEFADTAAQEGAVYRYRVRARNAAGTSEFAASADVGMATAAPSGLIATTTVGSAAAELAWVDRSSRESRFELERSTDEGSTWSALATVGADVTAYADPASASNALYRVRAVGPAGASDWSNVAGVEDVVILPDCDLAAGEWSLVDNPGSGSAVHGQDGITLVEGTSFVVAIEQQIEVPAHPAVLSIRYADLAFDTSDGDSINDAFELALVGADGRPLVDPFAAGRDAFFNVTESLAPALGDAAGTRGDEVRLDLDGVPAGAATLIVRLVNND